MLPYEEYVQRFANLGAEMVTTKEQYETQAELVDRKSHKVKFTIIPACCEEKYNVRWNEFKKNKDNNCSRCNRKAMGQDKRETYESCKKRFEDYGATLITTEAEYNTDLSLGLSRFMFKIKAKCDHIRDTKFHNFEKDVATHGVCMSCAGKIRMKNYDTVHVPYVDIKKLFEDSKCEIITTEQEYIDKKLNICREFEYKGACGHITKEILLDIEFKKDKPVNCKECREAKAQRVRSERLDENGRLNNLNVEDEAASWIKELIEDNFIVMMTKEGCTADMAIKPKEIEADAWMAVQLKAAGKTRKESDTCYNFGIGTTDYNGMVMLFTAKPINSVWKFDYGDVIENKSGLTICTKSYTKYFKFKVPIKYLVNELHDSYFDKKYIKASLQTLKKREFTSVQNEDKYNMLRTEKITFLRFDEVQNYSVTDFKVNGLKVQEKLAKKDHGQFIVNLHKSKNKDKKIPYDKNDNDIYWFHLDDWRLFYVIPEAELLDKGHITDGDKVGNKYISIYPKLYNEVPKKNSWIENYVFDYNNIDTNRLKEMFGVNLEKN